MGSKLRDGPASSLCRSSRLASRSAVVGAPTHQFGTHSEPGSANGVWKANPGTGERRFAWHEEDPGQAIRFGLHFGVPHSTATGANSWAGDVLEQEVSEFVGDRVGAPTVGVHRVEDDQPASSSDDRARREATSVQDREQSDRPWIGSLGHQISDGNYWDAVFSRKGKRVEAIIVSETELSPHSCSQPIGRG